jgi:hypothetical protein
MWLIRRPADDGAARLGRAKRGLPSLGTRLRSKRESLEQHRQLVRVNLDACDIEPDRSGKSETTALEPFVHDRESAARPHQHLHLGLSAIDEK